MGIILLFISTLLLCLSSRADVYAFPDRDVHVSTSIASQVYDFTIRDNETNKSLDFQPNMGGLIIPSVTYRDVWALSWAFDSGANNDDKFFKGETDYTDIRFDFTFRSFSVNTFYSQYRGLYIDNSNAVDPTIEESDPKILKPNMYALGYGASITWVWDSASFSLPNLMTQAERQEKYGGSLLFGGGFSEGRVKDDIAFVPPVIQNQFERIGTMVDGRFQTLELKAGYGYAYAKKWFVGGALQLGTGLVRKSIVYEDGSRDTGFEPLARMELLFSGGYNGDVFFSSFKVDAKQNYFFLTGSSSQMTSGLFSAALTFGVHLNTINI